MFCRCKLRCTLLILSTLCSSVTASCLPWHYYDNTSHQCQCGHGLICSNRDKVEIAQGHCATSAGYENHYYIGRCPFLHTVNNTNRLFSEMPGDPDTLDDVMCGPYNRKGLLCGECFDGFGPAVYSIDFKCANCSQLSTRYAVMSCMVIELFPITLIFIGMLFLRFDITSGPLIGYIVFCQVIAYIAEDTVLIAYTMSHVSQPFQTLLSISLILCRLWTMHWILKSVIPPFCISEKLRDIHVKMLALVFVTYPFILVI